MVRRWTADRELDERTFRYTVDVAVPQGGLGARLEGLVGWCNRHAGLWALHSHSADRREYARFYFLQPQVADAFARLCGDGGAVPPPRAAGAGDGGAPRPRRGGA
ncbi:MAG: hypothetical protein IRY94_03525 [Rhodospirillaceae bacterium]|nr:hypothetical protein [Rhodospirillaceae bacterium]